MTIYLHKNDLPGDIDFGPVVAVDTETMGLNANRDRLCLVQLSAGDGDAHLVQLSQQNYDVPNLIALLGDSSVTKIFHYARFDLAMIKLHFGVDAMPVFCTKIASKLARTYTDKHGLRDVCRELVNIDLSKQQQSSDWGADELTEDQKNYAASDVLYLHEIKEKLENMLKREGRLELAQACFDFLPTRAGLDLEGWVESDIFAHNA